MGVMLASLVLALAGVEWYLARIWPVGGCVLQLDDELLFTTIPGASHVQFMSPSLTGRSVVVRVNQHGMLGPEPQDPLATAMDGLWRLLCHVGERALLQILLRPASRTVGAKSRSCAPESRATGPIKR